MPAHFDNIIVGAGLAGLVLAERLANGCGETVLLVEKRDHIGGNCHDGYSSAGVLYHHYGPHYFRTNSQEVIDYLSQFTAWRPHTYRVLSNIAGRYYSFPINLRTFEQIIGQPATPDDFAAWLEAQRLPIAQPRNSEEWVLSQVGPQLYEMFFRGYTQKQWRRDPKELDVTVCARIPLRLEADDRYFGDRFQALPAEGYHVLFRNLLHACRDRVRVLLNTDYHEALPWFSSGHLYFTGPLDEYFDYCYGRLPYRSLRFEVESYTREQLPSAAQPGAPSGFYQPALQVNYPGAEPFTRIVEMKHATGQTTDATTIVREYPEDFGPGREAFYPVPSPDAHRISRLYQERAAALPHVTFLGRLAEYRYYNMDQVIAKVLHQMKKRTAALEAVALGAS